MTNILIKVAIQYSDTSEVPHSIYQRLIILWWILFGLFDISNNNYI